VQPPLVPGDVGLGPHRLVAFEHADLRVRREHAVAQQQRRLRHADLLGVLGLLEELCAEGVADAAASEVLEVAVVEPGVGAHGEQLLVALGGRPVVRFGRRTDDARRAVAADRHHGAGRAVHERRRRDARRVLSVRVVADAEDGAVGGDRSRLGLDGDTDGGDTRGQPLHGLRLEVVSGAVRRRGRHLRVGAITRGMAAVGAVAGGDHRQRGRRAGGHRHRDER
jgi:hypothetical protein